MDAWAVGMLVALGTVMATDESGSATGVSFFTKGCAIGALSTLLLDGALSFETAIGDTRAAANGSSVCAASFGFDRVNSKLLV